MGWTRAIEGSRFCAFSMNGGLGGSTAFLGSETSDQWENKPFAIRQTWVSKIEGGAQRRSVYITASNGKRTVV